MERQLPRSLRPLIVAVGLDAFRVNQCLRDGRWPAQLRINALQAISNRFEAGPRGGFIVRRFGDRRPLLGSPRPLGPPGHIPPEPICLASLAAREYPPLKSPAQRPA